MSEIPETFWNALGVAVIIFATLSGCALVTAVT